jgi:hypothetical protein
MQDRPVWRRHGFHQGNLAVPFRFTGTLDKLTIKLNLPNAAAEKLLQ